MKLQWRAAAANTAMKKWPLRRKWKPEAAKISIATADEADSLKKASG